MIYANNQGLHASDDPIAVGRILAAKMPEDLTEKAVKIEHFLSDELWDLGTKDILDETHLEAKYDDAEQEENEDEEEVKEFF